MEELHKNVKQTQRLHEGYCNLFEKTPNYIIIAEVILLQKKK
jgi:hypothetical protein